MDSWDDVQPLVRNLASVLAGFLVTKGYADSGSNEVVIGLAMGFASLLWSIYHKNQMKTKVDVALSLPQGSTQADLKANLPK